MPAFEFLASIVVAVAVGYGIGCARGWYVGYKAGRYDNQLGR